ncbi:MAG TPA: LAGLIDADG family homing endonuclease, partial [Nitrososphaerales archaeon]|nr:LAGLIDADG family homing endonuclease [Nitrososphaerales archaeon]
MIDRNGNPVYRAKISQLISSEGKSLVVDFGDLLKYNSDLANRVLLEPDSSLASFKIAAFETMRSENALYADRVKHELTVRLRGLTDLVPLRRVDTSYIDHMIAISGMVVRTSELRPMMTEAAWVCPSGHLTYEAQEDLALKRPPKCELCGEARNFELDKRHSRFIDFQVVRVQELPEELPPGQLPQFFDVNVEGDIVNTARPGDRVVLTGVVRAVPDYTLGQVRTRLFRSQIDCNHVEVKGKEPEQVLVTKEDEDLIKKIAGSPDAYERLVSSIAPVILGHQSEKEAILLLLAGGSATVLPDGTKLRGDINALFVGDPGCLVADERVILGNGAIARIGEIGRAHLQPLDLQVLTGEGGGKRSAATRFHIYRQQPILEVVTESGKSIKGTYNHPLLVLDNEDGRLVKLWKRLDELKTGDRIAAITGFPCTITRYQRTGFKVIQPRLGPRFRGRLPDVVDEDLAGYLGYVLGDGFVDRYSVVATVAETEIDILPKLRAMASRLFDVKPRLVRRLRADRNVRMTDLYLNSECVATNLAFLREKRVPHLILSSGNKVVAQFLRWLFEADGTVFSKGRGRRAIGLKAKDIELLRDVQILLLRWGIHSRIDGNALLVRRGEDMVRYRRYIGFVSRKKVAKLEALAVEAREFGRVHRQMSEKVVTIYQRPPEDVYDIEVPEGHRFIANGLVSHNTGKSELLKFASQVAPRGLYASGRGTTAAGLSAAVIREKNVLMLEAGVVVLADLGIACLHPSTTVLYNNRIISIRELAERVDFVEVPHKGGTQEVGIATGRLFSLDETDYKIKSNMATRIRRRHHDGHLLSVFLRSGNRLQLTDDHLLLDGNSLEWKPAGKFTVGDFVIAPLWIPRPAYDELFLWDILPSTCIVSLNDDQKAQLRHLLEEKFRRLSTAGSEIGVPRVQSYFRNRLQPTLSELKKITRVLGVEEEWKRRFYVYDGCYVAANTITPEMAYLCGFVRGDACVKISRRRASMVVTQSPVHQAYIDHFGGYWEQIFPPLSFRRRSSFSFRRREGKAKKTGVISEGIEWSVGKRVFGHIYQYMTGNNLANMLALPDGVLQGLVAGLTDADGCHGEKLSWKNGSIYQTWNITYEIASDDETNLNFLLALKRFGVVGTYRGVRKGVGIVVVSSRSDVMRLQEELADYSVKMSKVPGQRKHNVSGISEKLPTAIVQRLFKEAFDGRPTTEFGREGISSTVYEYKNGARQPSVGQVLKVVERHRGIPPETLRSLRELVRKDYYLDEIVSIEKVPYDGYVYDLVMDGPPNFIANGILVHNCIDEFEKMKPEDRTALHEMMEQHTVTIAKGGIYATLNARTAILAACNPVLGRYNPFQNLTENIGTLPIPLLTRFDIIFVFRDQPTPAEDERLATHILAVHAKKSYAAPPPIEFTLLKKYLTYCKRISPELTKPATDRIRDYYLELRKTGGVEDSIPPTPRTLEALIRIATARARVLLRDEVTEEDALAA